MSKTRPPQKIVTSKTWLPLYIFIWLVFSSTSPAVAKTDELRKIKKTKPSEMTGESFRELIEQVLPVRNHGFTSEQFFELYFDKNSRRNQLYQHKFWWDFYLDHVDTIKRYDTLAKKLEVSLEDASAEEIFVNYALAAFIYSRNGDELDAVAAAQVAVEALDDPVFENRIANRVLIWFARHWTNHRCLDEPSIKLLKTLLHDQLSWGQRPVLGDLMMHVCREADNQAAIDWLIDSHVSAFKALTVREDKDRYGAETTQAGVYVANVLFANGRNRDALRMMLDAQRKKRYSAESHHQHTEKHQEQAAQFCNRMGTQMIATELLGWLDQIHVKDSKTPPMPFVLGYTGYSSQVWSATEMTLRPLAELARDDLIEQLDQRESERPLTLNELVIRELAAPKTDVMKIVSRMDGVLSRIDEWKKLPPEHRITLWFFAQTTMQHSELDGVTQVLTPLALDAAANLNGQLWWAFRLELLKHVERREIAEILNRDATRNWKKSQSMPNEEIEGAVIPTYDPPKNWPWNIDDDPARTQPEMLHEAGSEASTKAKLFRQMVHLRGHEKKLHTSLGHLGSLFEHLVVRLENREQWNLLRKRWLQRGESDQSLYEALASVLLPTDDLNTILSGNASQSWTPDSYQWEIQWIWDEENLNATPDVFCLSRELCELAVETGNVAELNQRLATRTISDDLSELNTRNYWYLRYWLAAAQNDKAAKTAAVNKLIAAMGSITNHDARNNVARVFASYPLAVCSYGANSEDADRMFAAMAEKAGDHELDQRYYMLMMSGAASHWLNTDQDDKIYEYWHAFQQSAENSSGSLACGYSGGGRWCLRMVRLAIQHERYQLAGQFLRLGMDHFRHREQANAYVYIRDTYKDQSEIWSSLLQGTILGPNGQATPWIFDPREPRTEGGCAPSPSQVALRAGAQQTLSPLSDWLNLESADAGKLEAAFQNLDSDETLIIKRTLQLWQDPNNEEAQTEWKSLVGQRLALSTNATFVAVHLLQQKEACRSLLNSATDRWIQLALSRGFKVERKDYVERRIRRLAHLLDSDQTTTGLESTSWHVRELFYYDHETRRLATLNSMPFEPFHDEPIMGRGAGRWSVPEPNTFERSFGPLNEQLHLNTSSEKPNQLLIRGTADLFSQVQFYNDHLHITVRPYRCHLNHAYNDPVYDKPVGWIAIVRAENRLQSWTFFEPKTRDDKLFELSIQLQNAHFLIQLNGELLQEFQAPGLNDNFFVEFESDDSLRIEHLSHQSIPVDQLVKPNRVASNTFETYPIEHPGWRRGLLKTSRGIESDRN